MLLLLLHMNPTSASQASWRRIRIPVKAGARRAKLASERDQEVYRAVRLGVRLR